MPSDYWQKARDKEAASRARRPNDDCSDYYRLRSSAPRRLSDCERAELSLSPTASERDIKATLFMATLLRDLQARDRRVRNAARMRRLKVGPLHAAAVPYLMAQFERGDDQVRRLVDQLLDQMGVKPLDRVTADKLRRMAEMLRAYEYLHGPI